MEIRAALRPLDPVAPSYVHGASGQPLIGETIGRYFDTVCARGGARDALIVRHQGVRLTYAQLRERAREIERLKTEF